MNCTSQIEANDQIQEYNSLFTLAEFPLKGYGICCRERRYDRGQSCLLNLGIAEIEHYQRHGDDVVSKLPVRHQYIVDKV